jgi:hypothetical protein
MQIDKQTIKPLHPLTLPSFLKNDEQTDQAGFQNIFNALPKLFQKTKIEKILACPEFHRPRSTTCQKFWPEFTKTLHPTKSFRKSPESFSFRGKSTRPRKDHQCASG